MGTTLGGAVPLSLHQKCKECWGKVMRRKTKEKEIRRQKKKKTEKERGKVCREGEVPTWMKTLGSINPESQGRM
jgi:hypothetical protein